MVPEYRGYKIELRHDGRNLARYSPSNSPRSSNHETVFVSAGAFS